MNIIIDACSWINLSNAGACEAALSLPSKQFWMTSGARGECDGEAGRDLLDALNAGTIKLIEDNELPAESILDLLAQFKLGIGETESIAACKKLHYSLCTDDGNARKIGTKLLTSKRVCGSLRVLRWCVEQHIFACATAFLLYIAMVHHGGFLPKTAENFFCANVEGC